MDTPSIRYIADGKTAKGTGDARLTLDPKSCATFGEGDRAMPVVEMEHEGRTIRFRPPRNVYVAGGMADGVTFDLSVASLIAGSAPAGSAPASILDALIAKGDVGALAKYIKATDKVSAAVAKATAEALIG